jgi:hypothetical protein
LDGFESQTSQTSSQFFPIPSNPCVLGITEQALTWIHRLGPVHALHDVGEIAPFLSVRNTYMDFRRTIHKFHRNEKSVYFHRKNI